MKPVLLNNAIKNPINLGREYIIKQNSIGLNIFCILVLLSAGCFLYKIYIDKNNEDKMPEVSEAF